MDKKILILSSRNSTAAKNLKNILSRKKNDGLEFIFRNYTDIKFSISSGKVVATDSVSGNPLNSFSLVYFRTFIEYAEIAGAISDYLKDNNITFINNEVTHYHVQSKLSQYVKLAQAGVPVPESIYIPGKLLISSFAEIKNSLGTPFILKDIYSERGDNNFLVNNKRDFMRITKQIGINRLIAQRFIPSEGDLRLLIFNGRIYYAVRRSVVPGSHLSNVSKGAVSKVVESEDYSPLVESTAIRAAEIMNRQIAGVDIITHKDTGRIYVLEVNNSPQISSGSYVDKKVDAFEKFMKDYTKDKS